MGFGEWGGGEGVKWSVKTGLDGLTHNPRYVKLAHLARIRQQGALDPLPQGRVLTAARTDPGQGVEETGLVHIPRAEVVRFQIGLDGVGESG